MEKSDRVLAYRNESRTIVGCATFRLWGKGKTKADVYIYVTPKARSCSIGKKLLHFALNRAIDSGNRHAALSAIEWNVRALRLYESVGFRCDKTMHYLRRF